MYFKRNALIVYYSEDIFVLNISILYLSWKHLETLINLAYWLKACGKLLGWISDEVWGTLKGYLQNDIERFWDLFPPTHYQAAFEIINNLQNENLSPYYRQEMLGNHKLIIFLKKSLTNTISK